MLMAAALGTDTPVETVYIIYSCDCVVGSGFVDLVGALCTPVYARQGAVRTAGKGMRRSSGLHEMFHKLH